ncbi:group 1 glycosyl transferase [Rhodanobacter spathiphylli B39]|uniref:Group 1 glycosyl transferase n=1 Tax=Rhodanobacter spathiphylli B39 TaxID=1163407 RepID=I4VV12_9GAMM|nr:group 1 glycosyl transferase [Rhodanobacter spathiphylli B39]
MDWLNEDIRTLGVGDFFRRLSRHAAEFRPDWIVGMSDTYYGWIANGLGRTTGARVAIDAYDNYEAYMPWNLPLHAFWRRSIRAADLVTAAGPQLAQRLQSHRRGGRPVEIIPMAADPEFRPLDKQACRRTLGLPAEGRLVGYVGSWARNRGTTMLIDSFRQARAVRPDLQLVLSGKPPPEALAEPGVVSTGYVPDAQLPDVINALDVACVVTADTSFGRYSYPAKLCEAMACHVPVVATDTEPVRWMLAGSTDHLVQHGDAASFAKRMLDLLDAPRAEYGPRPTWQDQALKLDQLFSEVVR